MSMNHVRQESSLLDPQFMTIISELKYANPIL